MMILHVRILYHSAAHPPAVRFCVINPRNINVTSKVIVLLR